MYLYLKFHELVLIIRVISSCREVFSKSWEFAYKAMAFYAAENGNLRSKYRKSLQMFSMLFSFRSQ